VTGVWSGNPTRGALALLSAERAAVGPARPTAFLDRDGILNATIEDPETGREESPLRVADVRLLPGAAAAVGVLVGAGFAIVCVSNQPAAAKGKLALADVLAVHERVLDLLAREGARLDASFICPHHPDGVVAELARQCPCRKPAPGMLLDAASAITLDLGASWMFGDSDADVVAGQAAGCRSALIEYPGSAHRRTGSPTPDVRASDLGEAVVRIVDHPLR
jgi:histidinol-phosphate phosphatase family protein